MSHAVADFIARQAEGSALTIEEQIKSNLIAMESIRAAAMTLADSMCAVLADQNKALTKLAAAQRAGLGIMPPVTTQLRIDPETLVADPIKSGPDASDDPPDADQPRLTEAELLDGLAKFSMVKPSEADGAPQNETQKAA